MAGLSAADLSNIWPQLLLTKWTHTHSVQSGIFLHPLGGLTPPYFFLYTPDQFELVTPPWGGQVSDRCRGSTGHFVNRPNTVCWGDTGESAAAAHPHRVELAGRQPHCRRAVARHSSRSSQTRALSFETPQLLSLLCLHARPSTGAAAAR